MLQTHQVPQEFVTEPIIEEKVIEVFVPVYEKEIVEVPQAWNYFYLCMKSPLS